MTKKQKFCRDCIHYSYVNDGCGNPLFHTYSIDLVSGQSIRSMKEDLDKEILGMHRYSTYKVVSAIALREPGRACGLEGLLWEAKFIEPKDGFFRSLRRLFGI